MQFWPKSVTIEFLFARLKYARTYVISIFGPLFLIFSFCSEFSGYVSSHTPQNFFSIFHNLRLFFSVDIDSGQLFSAFSILGHRRLLGLPPSSKCDSAGVLRGRNWTVVSHNQAPCVLNHFHRIPYLVSVVWIAPLLCIFCMSE